MVEPPCRSPVSVLSSAADGAPEVDAVVIVEAVVFRRDQRVDDARRDLLERHPLAVDALEFGEHDAVGGQHDGGRRGLGLAQIADAGRERDQREHVQQHQRGQRERRANGVALDGGAEAAKVFEDGSVPGVHDGAGRIEKVKMVI